MRLHHIPKKTQGNTHVSHQIPKKSQGKAVENCFFQCFLQKAHEIAETSQKISIKLKILLEGSLKTQKSQYFQTMTRPTTTTQQLFWDVSAIFETFHKNSINSWDVPKNLKKTQNFAWRVPKNSKISIFSNHDRANHHYPATFLGRLSYFSCFSQKFNK